MLRATLSFPLRFLVVEHGGLVGSSLHGDSASKTGSCATKGLPESRRRVWGRAQRARVPGGTERAAPVLREGPAEGRHRA